MAFRGDVVPDLFDPTVGADQKCAANDSEIRFAQELFHAPRAVRLDDVEAGVTAEVVVKVQLAFEAGLPFDGVAADSQQDYAALFEILLCVAKLGRLDGSAGRISFRIEEQHNPLATIVEERNFAPGVRGQTKYGGHVPFFELRSCHRSLAVRKIKKAGGGALR